MQSLIFRLLCGVLGLLIIEASAMGAEGGGSGKPNVLLICVDDLRPELGCYGADYVQSPNIDRLADAGTLFENHFVQAPTCGASRYALLTGQYGGPSNNALFERAAKMRAGEKVSPSMPAWFKQHGYETVSVGKVSHHPGGLGGEDWDDDSQPEMPDAWMVCHAPAGDWQHPRGWMHGLANGRIRKIAADMPVFEIEEVEDSAYPDGLTVPVAMEELSRLSQQERPFFLAVGLLRPHLPFGAPKRDFDLYSDVQLPPVPASERPKELSTWHASGEFMKYQRWGRDPNIDTEFADQVRRHYAACVTFADRQVGRLLEQLENCQLLENTIIVLWGDHGWHLGEHAIWGKHSLYEESLRSPLIICSPGSLQRPEPRTINKAVESVDVFPTLCEMANLSLPESLHGQSLITTSAAKGESFAGAVSYTAKARTLRTDRYRLVLHNAGGTELYDHRSDPHEQTNLAGQQPEVCSQLIRRLEERWQATRAVE